MDDASSEEPRAGPGRAGDAEGATIAVTVFVARLARNAIRRRTRIEEGAAGPRP